MLDRINRIRGKFKKANQPKTELRISLYGFRAELPRIKDELTNFFKKHAPLKVRVLLINLPEAGVFDLGSDKQDIDYITIKYSDKKILPILKKMLSKDENLSKHLVDYQQLVSFTTSDNL